MLETKEIYKFYAIGDLQVVALNGVDINIKEKEFIMITGPSGTGKSTLLNVLASFDAPDKGEVFFKGKKNRFSK